jgi:SAM-dependent methyltransferase
MKLKHRIYKEARITGFSRRDGSLMFYNFIDSVLTLDTVLLDVGCGRGESDDSPDSYISQRMNFRGKVKWVIGIDVDPVGGANRKIDEFRIITSDRWPLADDSIDVLFADFVLEHIESPAIFFDEIHRVLKSDGKFFIRTSNSLGYVGIISRLLPEKSHKFVLSKSQKTRREIDVFPAYYRANSIPTIRKFLRNSLLTGYSFTYEGEPAYFKFSEILYRLFVIFDFLIPAYFKNSIIIVGEK